jgi:DNA-binding IclR family transcriptional regulator
LRYRLGDVSSPRSSRRSSRECCPDGLKRHTPATVTARSALLAELETVRRTGVAFDREEHTGISAVGIAVRDPLGGLAAISVPMPTQRFPGREAEVARALLAACEEIMAALGVA